MEENQIPDPEPSFKYIYIIYINYIYIIYIYNLFLAVLDLCSSPGLYLVVASGGYSSLQQADFSFQWLLFVGRKL